MYVHLIQTGKFRKIETHEIIGIDSLISFNYMGSAEFEFGALPSSLNSIINCWEKYKVLELENIKDLNKQTCFLICLDNDEKELKSVVVPHLFSEKYPVKYRLKECCRMNDYILGDTDTNFWWDIENYWMCCFGLFNLQQLIKALRLVHNKKKTFMPDFGPKEIIGEKIRPAQTNIVKNFPLLKITDVLGGEITINLKNVKNVKVSEKGVFIDVVTKKQVKKRLFVMSEDRKDLIYKICMKYIT